jgi:hypothetical protein
MPVSADPDHLARLRLRRMHAGLLAVLDARPGPELDHAGACLAACLER